MELRIRVARSTGNLIVEDQDGRRAAIVEPETGKILFHDRAVADRVDIESAVAYYL